MSQENTSQENISIDSENIFDEFTNTSDIQNEIKKTEESKKKDIFYYLKKISFSLFVINLLIFLGVILMSLYVYIQNGDTKKEYSFLSPICRLILGSDQISPNTCYGVTPILSEYQASLQETSQQQAEKIFPILGDIYSIENFNVSKKVSFLLDTTETRLKPLEILESFDELKNTFSPTDKGEIKCYDISISDNNLDITCDAFSSDWNTDIITLNDGSVENLPGGGTSISRASSFIYFIENYRDSSFLVLEKPQSFSFVGVQSGPYTQMTTFSLKLKYSPVENLSF